MNEAQITRRSLMTGAAATGLGQGAAKLPNILFVMVDEMRWDAMSSEKHPVVSTPNLDRLAKQGVRFANAYTVAPVCSPARSCVFTGRYADVHGVTHNEMPSNPGEIFLPSILKHYGYHTAIAGKLHYLPKRFDFGFDQFWSFTNEGPTPDLGYMAYLNRKHGSPNKWPRLPGACPWPDDEKMSGYSRIPRPISKLSGSPIDRLSAQPHLKPHSPSVEPKRYFERFDPAAIPVPKPPANIKEIRAKSSGQQKRQFIDDEKMLRAISAVYYGSIEHIDDRGPCR